MRDLATKYNPRVQVARDANARIRFTSNNMPNGIYRADLLPPAPPEFGASDMELDHWENALEAAFVPAVYDEGFPTLPSGQPLWGILPWEPREAFELFEAYLQMGVRPKAEVEQPEEKGESEGRPRGGMRMLGILAQSLAAEGIKVELPRLQEYFYLYFWRIRAELHDTYQAILFRKQRSALAAQVDNDQLTLSKTLTQKALEYIRGEEFEALLTPKTAIELLRTGVMMERVSVGLPAQGPQEQLRGNGNGNGNGSGNGNEGSQSLGQDILMDDPADMLMSDPATLAAAQEFVIQLQKKGQKAQERRTRTRTVPSGATIDGKTGDLIPSGGGGGGGNSGNRGNGGNGGNSDYGEDNT